MTQADRTKMESDSYIKSFPKTYIPIEKIRSLNKLSIDTHIIIKFQWIVTNGLWEQVWNDQINWHENSVIVTI